MRAWPHPLLLLLLLLHIDISSLLPLFLLLPIVIIVIIVIINSPSLCRGPQERQRGWEEEVEEEEGGRGEREPTRVPKHHHGQLPAALQSGSGSGSGPGGSPGSEFGWQGDEQQQMMIRHDAFVSAMWSLSALVGLGPPRA